MQERSGARLLVDRIWPRGVSRADLKIDDWIKEAAPSTSLRKWFGHDPRRWTGFQIRYRAELDANPDAVAHCLRWCGKGPVVLLYSAKDCNHNQAVVLRDCLADALAGESGT
ncbi:MAG: DUF488 family protein [Hyphomicrobiaceae bacterium]|nr:DUF488 family protein [Hyphomicrobiaceae bacterium]